MRANYTGRIEEYHNYNTANAPTWEANQETLEVLYESLVSWEVGVR